MSKQEALEILKNIYCNFNRTNNCYYVYSYTPEYDPISKKTKKKNVVSIGKIFAENGLGPIQFNSKFLNQHPIFMSLQVRREGKNNIVIKEVDLPFAKSNIRSDMPISKRMRIGATYFIKTVIKKSYTGQALIKLKENGLIDNSTYQQLYTLLIYTIMEGFENIDAIEYFVRSHAVPYSDNFNKDTICKLFSILNYELITEFFKIKQQIIKNDLLKDDIFLNKINSLVIDIVSIDSKIKGSNLDIKNEKVAKKEPSNNLLILHDKTTNNLLEYHEDFKHIKDIVTLDSFIKQLTYYNFQNYNIIVDKDYLSIINLRDLFNLGIDFISPVNMSYTFIKKLVNKHLDDLCVGNGCIKLCDNNEISYAFLVELSASYYNINTKKKDRKPIFIYLFYDDARAVLAKQALEDEVRELNALLDEYKEALDKARKQKKKNPNPIVLTLEQQKLIDEGIVKLNTTSNRYDLVKEKAYEKTLPMGVWALASSMKMACEEIFLRYKQHKDLKARYSFLKNLEKNTFKASAESNLDDQLFINLLVNEFIYSLKLKALSYNKEACSKDKVIFLQNSLSLSLKDLDTLEGIYINENTIIPTSNMKNRHENLFKMLQIEAIK